MRRRITATALASALLAGCAGAGSIGPSTSAGVPQSAPSASVATAVSLTPSFPAATITCADAPSAFELTPETSIAELLAGDPRFEWFCSLVEQARSPGLGMSWLEIWNLPAAQMGDNRDGVTVFVPTDEAFEKLDPALRDVIEEGAASNDQLYELLGRHYVHSLYPSTDFEAGSQRTWTGTGAIRMTLDPLTFGGCNIVETDLRADNGFVHLIDCVVLPDGFAGAVRD